jgi:hypothetical protein
MKKLLFTLPLLAATIAAAQPQINENDVFIPGTGVVYGYQLLPNITSGNPGASQNYTMNGVSPDWTISQQMISVVQSPFGMALPGNRVLLYNNGDDGAGYFTRSAGVLNMNGTVSADAANPSLIYTEPYIPAKRIASLPMTYGQTDSGTTFHQVTFYVGMDLGNGWITDSIRRRTTEVYTYIFDGWGTLTTPFGTYTVLRQQTITETFDTLDYYRGDNNTWLNDFETLQGTNCKYTFWATGQSFPVAEMLDEGFDTFIDDCIWITNVTTGVKDDISKGSRPKIYPNPSTGRINLRANSGEYDAWVLSDLHGRTLREGLISREEESLDFTNLPAGKYLLRMSGTEHSVAERIVLQP